MTAQVYFVAGRGRIKIGMTMNVPVRMYQLRTKKTGPLELIGSIPGWRSTEQALHDHFAELWIEGEWFRDCQEMREALAQILSEGEFLTVEQRARRQRETRERAFRAPWDDVFAALKLASAEAKPADAALPMSGRWQLVRDQLQAAAYRLRIIHIEAIDCEIADDLDGSNALLAPAKASVEATIDKVRCVLAAANWNVPDAYLRGAA